MTIQDWGAVGEIVGAGAVFVSLIYLAVQIRQNTRQLKANQIETRLSSLDQNVRSGNHVRELILKDPEIADLFLRGIKSYTRLERIERFRMDLLLRNSFSGAQSAYLRVQMLDTGSDGPRKTVDSLVMLRGVREWLAATDVDWLPEFRAYVDERVALAKAADEAAQAAAEGEANAG